VAPDEQTLAAYAAAAPPLNFAEAHRSPHGRPACCFVVLGVGGRCVLQQPSLHAGDLAGGLQGSRLQTAYLHLLHSLLLLIYINVTCMSNIVAAQPAPAVLNNVCPCTHLTVVFCMIVFLAPGMDVSFATMGAGSMQLLPLTQLLATLKTACPVAETYSAAPMSYTPAAGAAGATGNATAGAGSSRNALSVAAFNKFLESFPGPLNASSSKDKVLKFLQDRLANYLQEEGLTDAPSWQVRIFSPVSRPVFNSCCLSSGHCNVVGGCWRFSHAQCLQPNDLQSNDQWNVQAVVFILLTACSKQATWGSSRSVWNITWTR
jgi:hypothetical protein